MKARIKKITIGDDEEISDIFNKMLKTDSIDMNIAFARYLKLKNHILAITDIMQTLMQSALMQKHPGMIATRADLARFIETTRAAVASQFNLAYPGFEWNYSLLDKDTQKKFADHYLSLKASNLINQFIVCCSQLTPYEAYIGDPHKLSYGFIKSMPGVSWQPLPFCRLDILEIYNLSGVGENTMKLLVTTLHTVWKFSRKIWREATSPDIDVNEFAEVILENLKKIERIPELARCKLAFKKIHEALDMLKGNFDGYYREFVATKDSSMILQSFLLDVQGSTDASPELTRQFNTIINFYRKNVAKSNDDPRLKQTMDKLQATMDQITKGADNLKSRSVPNSAVPHDTIFTGIPLQPEDTKK